MNLEELKRQAAAVALESVESGMVLGLGTGSTVRHFVELLAEALDTGRLKDIVGVPTSVQTRVQATGLGVPLVDLSDHDKLDLTVDGADEVGPGLDLIKGMGGALLREKMVAQASSRLLIISDDTKVVERLGNRSALPVEVIDWALGAHTRFLESTGARVSLRMTGDTPTRSDNGNVFLDCRYADGIENPAALEEALAFRAGIVDCGLFLGMTEAAIIASPNGVEIIRSDS